MKLFSGIVLFLVAHASAFVPMAKPPSAPRTSIVAGAEGKSPADALGAAALSLMIASAPLMVGPEPAMAAKSGGRVGGSRSYSSGRPAAAAPRPAARPAAGATAGGTTVVRNYYGGGGYGGGGVTIMPSISPFGYSPLSGMGTGYALGAMSSSGNRAETYRLENQVDRERQEMSQVEQDLAVQKEKNAELERRLNALEGK